MGLKNFVRSWLGIDQQDAAIEQIHRFASRLDDRQSEAANRLGRQRQEVSDAEKTLRQSQQDFRHQIDSLLNGSSQRVEIQVQKLVGTEAFIDEVVERLRRKQVSPHSIP